MTTPTLPAQVKSREDVVRLCGEAILAKVPEGYGMTRPEALEYANASLRALSDAGVVLVPEHVNDAMIKVVCRPYGISIEALDLLWRDACAASSFAEEK